MAVTTPTRIRIDQPLDCPDCGYDLRGLTLDANCPECGALAERSLDQLSLSDRRYLRRLRAGALLAGLAAVNVPVAYIAMVTAYFFFSASPTGAGAWTMRPEYLVFAAALAAGPVLGAFGWSRLRAAQPPVLLPEGRVHRPAYRPASALVLPLSLLYAAMTASVITAYSMYSVRPPRAWPSWGRSALPVVAGSAGCLWGLRMLVGLRHVSDLLRRLGRGRAAASAAFWAGTSLGAVGACVLGGILALILPNIPLYIRNLESYDLGLVCIMIALAAAAAITLGNAILQVMLIGALTRAMAIARSRTRATFVLMDSNDAAKPAAQTENA